MDKRAVALVLFCFLAFASSVQATGRQTEVTVDVIHGNAAYLTVEDQNTLAQILKDIELWEQARDDVISQLEDLALKNNELSTLVQNQIQFTGDDLFHPGMPGTQSVAEQAGTASGLIASAQSGIEQANQEIADLQDDYDQVVSQATADTAIPGTLSLTSVTETTSGYIIEAQSTGSLTITSGGNTVLLHPDSTVFLLADKDDGVQLVNVLQGGADFDLQDTATVVMVQESVVDYKHTSFSVEANGSNFKASAYAGDLFVWGFHTKNNYSLQVIPPSFQSSFDANGTCDGAKPAVDSEALKVIATKPDAGQNISSIRPVVGLFFNKPVGSINQTSIFLSNGSGTVAGHVFKSTINKLEFVPDEPLGKGTYFLSAAGVQDNSGAKMEPHSSNFTIQCNQPDAPYILQKPRLYNFTKTFYFRNRGPGTMSGFNVTLSLLRNDTNTFAWLKSFSSPPQYQRQDGAGNLYATWVVGNLDEGKSLNISVNYIVFSAGIDYFSMLPLTQNETPQATEYTKSAANIESLDSRIQAVARQNTEGRPAADALGLYNWMRKNIRYDHSLSQSKGAIPTLENRVGVCFGYATLYAALARADNIPVRYVSGWALWQNNETTADGHAWDEAYLQGRWLPVDTTWATSLSDYFAIADNRRVAEYEGVGTESEEGYHYAYMTTDPDYETNTSISYQVLDPSLLSVQGEFFRQLQYALLAAQYKKELETRLGWLNERKSWCDEYEGAAVSANALSLYGAGKENESVALLKAYTGPALNSLAADAGGYADNQLKVRKDLEGMGWHFRSDTGQAELLAVKEYLQAVSSATVKGNYSAALGYSRLALDFLANATVYLPPSVLSTLNASRFTDMNTNDINITYLQTSGNQPAKDVDPVTMLLVLAALVAVPLALLVLFVFWAWMLWDCLTRKEFARFGRLAWALIIVLGSAVGALAYFFAERNKSVKRA